MKRWGLLLALLLPLVWLGASIVRNQAALDEAKEWRIPIAGYDPRDPLRGRYIQFAYAWDVTGAAAACDRPEGCMLCLTRDEERVRAEVVSPDAICEARVDVRQSRIGVRPGFGDGEGPQFTSRLFVSETSAPELERQLQAGPMLVVAALAPDGRLINRRIEPG